MTHRAAPTQPAESAVPASTWQYSARTWDPDRDGDEEEWARRTAADGWRTWLEATGAWVRIDGRPVRVWSLRRPCQHPFSVHDHTTKCRDARAGT